MASPAFQKQNPPATLVRIGPKHQVTIPKHVFETLALEEGDFLEIKVQNGTGLMTPQRIVAKTSAPKLSGTEQKALISARKKMNAINQNLRTSKGLTEAEAEIAIRVGLIDAEQRWWWLEEWQSRERKAQRDIHEGSVSKAYENGVQALETLKSDL